MALRCDRVKFGPIKRVEHLGRLQRWFQRGSQQRSVDSARLVISLCGLSWDRWPAHLWLQHLPLTALEQPTLRWESADPHNLCIAVPAADGPERVAINLEWPAEERRPQWLQHLHSQQRIWDPDRSRVEQLQVLGLPAEWLDPEAPVNRWLQQPAAVDPERWAALLGLAPPPAAAAIVLGEAGPKWNRALAQQAARAADPVCGEHSIAYLPGWPELICGDSAAAIAQAGWLAQAAAVAEALVWVGAGPDPACTSLPVRQLHLAPPLTLTELRGELVGQPLQALAEDRLTPPLEVLFSWESPDRPQTLPPAAVLVSLFNYGHRITAALDSVAAQSQPQLELIVVDDASTDDGAAVVRAWMEAQRLATGHPFARLQLLRHQRNAGLAAARNTAFAAARAPWCFVLDADNALYPRAVAVCMQLAHTATEQLAVVHPLLAVEAEAGRPDEQRSLVSTASWQRQRLKGGNVVDAMALVRRSAWQAVGGYTHIEGGWEDFDFWCKLIEAGYHGLQCPELLAVYRSHAGSMSHSATNRSWRALSRTLQQRHPWLELPLA
jgi:GT2 family glycosyltransferase